MTKSSMCYPDDQSSVPPLLTLSVPQFQIPWKAALWVKDTYTMCTITTLSFG